MLIIHLLSIFISLVFMIGILFLVYKRMLREEYSLLWLLGGIILVILSQFRGVLVHIAKLLEISYPPSLLFVIGILFLVIIVISQAVSITTLVRRDRDLTQKLAILEWNLEQLRKENAVNKANSENFE